VSDHAILAVATPLVPALFVLLQQALRGRRRGVGIRVGIQALTYGAVGLYAVLLLGWPRQWGEYVGIQSLRFSAAPTDLFRLFLFSLWLGLSARVLQASRTDRGEVGWPEGAMRSASSASRASASPVSARSWLFTWGIWWYGAVACLISLLVADPGSREGPWAATLLLLSVALALVWWGPSRVDATLLEAEPADPSGSRELADSYAVHRSKRASGSYWLTLALVAWMSSTVVVAVWVPEWPSPLRLITELTAFSIGIGGAAHGLEVSARSRRLRRTLTRLLAEADIAGAAGPR